MIWFNSRDEPRNYPPPGLFDGGAVASPDEVHAMTTEMFAWFDLHPGVARNLVFDYVLEHVMAKGYNSAAFLTVLYFADQWLTQREQNEYTRAYKREELRLMYDRRGGNPWMFDMVASGEGNKYRVPKVNPPSRRQVSLQRSGFDNSVRILNEARAWLARKEAEEAEREKHAQAKHELLKKEARAAEAERRQVLLHRNQDRLAQAREAEREAEQRALDEKRRKEQAAAQRAEQKKQKDKERQQASSEVSGVSDDALRKILAEQEAAEKAAAAEGQGSSAWHALTATLTPEEEARMRAEAEAAERERKEEKDDWIAKAAQKREAKQAKKGKGKGKAPAPQPEPEPRPQLPPPERVDLDEMLANAMRPAQLGNRRRDR